MVVSYTLWREDRKQAVSDPAVLRYAGDGLGPRHVRLQLAPRDRRERVRRKAAACRRAPVSGASGAYVTVYARGPRGYVSADVVLRLVPPE